MTRDEIIRMAREVGIDAESDTLCRHEGWVDPLTSFAERVFLNIDPSKLMSFQEGYAAGVAAEREACAKVCIEVGATKANSDDGLDIADLCAAAITARGGK